MAEQKHTGNSSLFSSGSVRLGEKQIRSECRLLSLRSVLPYKFTSAEKCKKVAEETMKKARSLMGLR
jgi:hypothetical protein